MSNTVSWPLASCWSWSMSWSVFSVSPFRWTLLNPDEFTAAHVILIMDWRGGLEDWSQLLILIWSSTIFIFKIVLYQSVLTDDETEQQVLSSCKGEQTWRGHQPGDPTLSGPGTFGNIYFEHLSWNLTKTRTFEFVFLILKTLFFTCWDNVFTLTLHFLQQEVAQSQQIKHWCIFFSVWDFVKTPKFVQFMNICTSNH